MVISVGVIRHFSFRKKKELNIFHFPTCHCFFERIPSFYFFKIQKFRILYQTHAIYVEELVLTKRFGIEKPLYTYKTSLLSFK